MNRSTPFSLSQRIALLVSALILALLVRPAATQCSTQWLPGTPLSGVNGVVRASIEWDRDGAGPGTPVVVLGGSFAAAGTVTTSCVVTYDPLTGAWASLGSGPGATVRALAVLPNNDLVAAVDGSGFDTLARWDGTSWSPLDFMGPTGDVRALVVLPNGKLIAGGSFTLLSSPTFTVNVAQWDGIGWTPLAYASTSSPVFALAALPSGDLFAGGPFTSIGGVPAQYVARWNGTTWSAVGSGLTSNVLSLLTLPNGNVVAGTANNVAQWNGASWSQLGNTVGRTSLVRLPNGNLAGVSFAVETWNGTSWSVIGQPINGTAMTLCATANGVLVAGGDLQAIGGVHVESVATWNGTSWASTGAPPLPLIVYGLTTSPNGDSVAAMVEFGTSTAPVYEVVRWNGGAWSRIGPAFSDRVDAVATLPNGDVVAAGKFTSIGGSPINRIARWDGTAWVPLGSGLGALTFVTLHVAANGDLIAGGDFTTAGGVATASVARWNGLAWSPMSNGLAPVIALATASNGDVVAATSGLPAFFHRWNGATWTQLASLSGLVSTVSVLGNGNIVAGGRSLAAGGNAVSIAQWNGSAWSEVGTGITALASNLPGVTDLELLPDGDLVAVGYFSYGPFPGIARWDGMAWSPLATSLTGACLSVAMHRNGDLAFGGTFATIDGIASARIARLTTTCPATAVASSNGCTGSGGPNVLTATALPWIGSTARALASGLPTPSLALAVYGFSTAAIPMPVLLPAGTPGCLLSVGPDYLELMLPAGGVVPTALPLPDAVALVGQVLHEQVVPIELGATGNIVAVTATNRLTLTIGAF